MNENKYKLEIGIHSGTITTRDMEQPKYFDTKEEALQEFKEAKEWYNSIGYLIWYAYLTSPDKSRENLESNSYYS